MVTFSRRRIQNRRHRGPVSGMGVRRGWPDIQTFHADGRVMFLEIKRPGGKLSPDQRRIADHLIAAGHAFKVVDSVEAAIQLLVDWNVVRTMRV